MSALIFSDTTHDMVAKIRTTTTEL